ncbi:hypothetical protein Tco_1192566 [Tanacetum coccineum]
MDVGHQKTSVSAPFLLKWPELRHLKEPLPLIIGVAGRLLLLSLLLLRLLLLLLLAGRILQSLARWLTLLQLLHLGNYPGNTHQILVAVNRATIGHHIGALDFKIPHLSLNFLDLISQALFIRHHFPQVFAMDSMSCFSSSGLNMGIPPCQSIILQSASHEFDLTSCWAIANAKHILHFLKPSSESATNSLSALKSKVVHLKNSEQEHSRAVLAGPWVLKPLYCSHFLTLIA